MKKDPDIHKPQYSFFQNYDNYLVPLLNKMATPEENRALITSCNKENKRRYYSHSYNYILSHYYPHYTLLKNNLICDLKFVDIKYLFEKKNKRALYESLIKDSLNIYNGKNVSNNQIVRYISPIIMENGQSFPLSFAAKYIKKQICEKKSAPSTEWINNLFAEVVYCIKNDILIGFNPKSIKTESENQEDDIETYSFWRSLNNNMETISINSTTPVESILFNNTFSLNKWSDLYLIFFRYYKGRFPSCFNSFIGTNIGVSSSEIDVANRKIIDHVDKSKFSNLNGNIFIRTDLMPDDIINRIRFMMCIAHIEAKDVIIKYKRNSTFPKQKKISNNKLQYNDFIVKTGVYKCHSQGHDISEITALISCLDSDGVIQDKEVMAGYCADCQRYFILNTEFERLKNNYILLCRVIDESIESKIIDNKPSFSEFSKESILMQYGYNVNKQSDLSDIQRQIILKLILDNKILTKTEICTHLDWLINSRKYDLNKFRSAIEKWQSDRKYVENYKPIEFEKVAVSTIIKK